MKREKWKQIISLNALALSIVLSACSGKEDIPSDSEQNDMLIQWSVLQEGMNDGRTLISNDETLQYICTPNKGGKAIGIWSAYEKNGAIRKNVLGENDDVSLIYNIETQDDNYFGWTYGPAALWVNDATYFFKAYFPKDAVQIVPSSDNSTNFSAKYNTITTQDDFMLAYTYVVSPIYPVPLQLHHALAALRFQFKSKDGETMYLKSFSFSNTDSDTDGKPLGLSTSGTISFQKENISISDWTPDVPILGSFYQWEYPNSNGLAFNDIPKNAYQYDTNTTIGKKYTENEGYVLIIPQKYNGDTNLNITINNVSYPPVKLDKVDFLPGYRYTYLITVAGNSSLTITCTVQPWTLQEENMDFEHYVNMDAEGQLRWLSGSVEEKADNVNEVFLNAETIQCSFHIATPEGATWYASLIPVDGNDMNAFSFVDGDGTETGLSISGKVGETSALNIKRKTIKEYTRMRLQLIVKDLNGRTFMVHKDVLGSENYIWCQP